MASKQVSPSAQLLRRSRLFSLPPSLPRPGRERRATSAFFESDTATLPHPIYASIETTEASRSRGDWGLKRPLPLKSTTRSTTPIVRVKEVDNIDHITNFESAADHSLTLEKWQEMHLSLDAVPNSAISKFSSIVENSTRDRNVFDAYADQSTGAKSTGQRAAKRWKFKGPWLGGMNNIEFEKYVEHEIKRRRPEFRKYLCTWVLENKRDEAMAQAQDAGELEQFDRSQVSLSEDEFQTSIVQLRHQGSTLNDIIWKFLDLPGRDTKDEEIKAYGPPATHPSAGLSYLRTHKHLHNHSLLGPQGEAPPVQARILHRDIRRYKKQVAGDPQRGTSAVGVGGIVGTIPGITPFKEGRAGRKPFETHGGEREYVKPLYAAIDSKGKIVLQSKEAELIAREVWEHEIPELTAQAKKETGDISRHINIGSEELLKTVQARATR